MSYEIHRYRSKQSMEEKIIFGFFKGLWWLISWPFRLILKKPKINYAPVGNLDKNYAQEKWSEIEELMRLGNPSNYARAVLEADKLLDHLLKNYRAPGLTMGDRLKSSRNKFSTEAYDAAWKAHRVRNELVHNSEYALTDFIAKPAIANFKKAIGELI